MLAPAAQALGQELAARLQQDAAAHPGTAPATRPSRVPCRVAAGDADGWNDDPDYQRLGQALGHDPATLDELVGRSGLSPAALASMLLMLELEGRVEGLPGNRYQRLGPA